MNPSGLAQVDAHLMFGLAHAFFQPQFAGGTLANKTPKKISGVSMGFWP